MSRVFAGIHAVSRSPGLRRTLSRVATFVPDVTLEREVAHAGRLAFGLRRHRWLLHAQCFAGHQPVLSLFQHLIRPGDTLYDVGANIGYYARFALARFPLGGLVAFEPMAANVKLLRRNSELADTPFPIYPVALADSDEDAAELQVDDQSDGSAVLSKVNGGEASEGRAAKGLQPLAETVPQARLDTLLPREMRLRPDLPPPDVIKIDTEGAEHLVLAGALQTLRRHRPRLILAAHGTDRAETLLELLARVDYHAAGRADDTWRLLRPGDAARLTNNNFIASADVEDVAIEPVTIRL
jgi:FkbM family methyltransferase